ncbi:helix-turn-helix transcriptional regulator [Tautonia plasticadhaerens]|uniref:Helix-turn-helix domain-containing protein n=1 Tax=Tautonia plasticadhaerens TaxID=2527974 RepID=A0A518H9Q2_9BACT|nr:helix-turn-helix domain-containing protein [Tautonia plasticadhaerens]QDV37466.1 hypothetical protein ElP_54050 [Tautonia plasticadhaerens]
MNALPTPEPVASDGASPRRLIGLKDAARLYSVSWRTFLRWADAGRVPWGFKIGGRRLWSLEELERHIREGCRPVSRVRR